MDENVNIYVASFGQRDEYNYKINYKGPDYTNLDAWFVGLGITKINKGDIICIDGPDEVFIEGCNPAYLIAKEDYDDYDLSSYGPGDNIPEDLRHAVRIPRYVYGYVRGENQGKMSVNINNNECFPTNIWELIDSEVPEATVQPWSFITEGVVTDYVSMQWNDGYNEVGSFQIVLPATDENIDLFQTERYLLIDKSDKIMIIEKTKLNGNFLADGYTLQVSGRSLESILDRRVAFPGMDLDTLECKGDGGLIYAIYKVIDAYFIHPEVTAQVSNDGNKFFYYPERRISFFEIPQETATGGMLARTDYLKRLFNASINKNIIKDNILEFVTENCKNNNLGFKIIAEPKYDNCKHIVWRFILYTGEDKSYNRTDKSVPPLIFSPSLNNVKTVSTTVDSSNYKNVVFCGAERDGENYIDLAATQDQMSNLLNINMPSTITSLANKITTHFQQNSITYTGELFLAIAANMTDKSYSATVKYFRVVGGITTLSSFLWDQSTPYDPDALWEKITVNHVDYYRILKYPFRPITKEEAAKIDVIFYITNGQEYGYSKTGEFNLLDIESGTRTVEGVETQYIGFKQSTSSGWLTATILREATSGVNTLSEVKWSNPTTYLGGIKKTAILAWFKTLDKFTGGGTTQTKWLCQLYDRSNQKSGIDRKEVFVEQENDDDNKWDASAINAFRQSTTVLTTTAYQDDEDTDEKVNEKLMESARKQSGNYNAIRDVDVDVETLYFNYMIDYNLGDIVQVDDGHGLLDSYYISGTIITNDTTDGLMIIPQFTKYELIPNAYMQIEYIRVANMLLPVKYCEQENVINTEEEINYGTSLPDIGPSMDHNEYNYKGYIDGIINERRSKWTEFELHGAYNQYEKPDGSQSDPLISTFSLLSAVGYHYSDPYNFGYDKYLLPYALLSSTSTTPLVLGLSTGVSSMVISSRYFYQYIGDYTVIDTVSEPNKFKGYTTPGIGIKWEKTASEINNNYLDAIYRSVDDSGVHTFYLNKAVEDTSNLLDRRTLKYSKSYIDSDTNLLSKRPQYQFAFPFDGGYYYRQSSEWDYGHPTSPSLNDPNNDYMYNPWTKLANAGQYTTVSYLAETQEYSYYSSYEKYVQLSCEKFDKVCPPYENLNLNKQVVCGGLLPGEGAFGQIPFDNIRYDFYTPGLNNDPLSYLNIDNNITNSSNYRYMILGGCAYRTESGIVWHSRTNGYSDTSNGLYLTNLKVFEYESSYRVYNFSKYKLNDTSNAVDNGLLVWYGCLVGTEPIYWAFRNARSASENPDLSSRKLVHDYVPVKYIDVGNKKPDNVEIYGLYDLIDQRFIPVNYCPDATIFGATTNSQATFIDAGGEVPKY